MPAPGSVVKRVRGKTTTKETGGRFGLTGTGFARGYVDLTTSLSVPVRRLPPVLAWRETEPRRAGATSSHPGALTALHPWSPVAAVTDTVWGRLVLSTCVPLLSAGEAVDGSRVVGPVRGLCRAICLTFLYGPVED